MLSFYKLSLTPLKMLTLSNLVQRYFLSWIMSNVDIIIPNTEYLKTLESVDISEYSS